MGLHLGMGGEAVTFGIDAPAVPAARSSVSFVLVPIVPMMEPVRWSADGAGFEFHVPTDRPDAVLRCRVEANPRDVAQLHRLAHRALNHRRSGWAIAGMVLLLAVCGWAVGGEQGARRALAGSAPSPDGETLSPDLMWRAFGARPLLPGEMPMLFAVLHDLCRRARLARAPDLYYVPAAGMNAYALGGPDRSAITLTDGLLRGMTLAEIAGILAHEIAHIRNNDGWAMSWAAGLQRAIESTSLTGLAWLHARPARAASERRLAALLAGAPAIGRLLGLALSRIRELDADATALDLVDDSHALIAALDKLEQHHTGSRVPRMAAHADEPGRYLRSHPATAERVGALLRLAH